VLLSLMVIGAIFYPALPLFYPALPLLA